MEPSKNYIVLRYQRVTYHGIGGIEAHGKRLGELPNVDRSRTKLNGFLIGDENLVDIVDAHIVQMQLDNVAQRRASKKRRRRAKEVAELDRAVDAAGDDPRALAEVIGWPWDEKNVWPFTEGILSVSHDWFLDNGGEIAKDKVETFKTFALGYLAEEFGNEVIYARLDLDEKTPHLAFVVAPEYEHRQTKHRTLSHNQHRLFGHEEVCTLFEEDAGDHQLVQRSYELLQNRVADYAHRQGLDIVRGESRAQDERLQRLKGERVIKRRNIPPSMARELGVAIAGEMSSELDEARKKNASAEAALARARAAEAEAGRRQAAAASHEAMIEEQKRAIDVGMEAILDEQLIYSPQAEDRPEGLRWGPNRPHDPNRRNWLREAIQPARDWLVGFARIIWQRATRKSELDRMAAEQRQRADDLIRAERMAGRSPTKCLLDIVNSEPVTYTAASFPGAWALRADMSPDDMRDRCHTTSNLDLRFAFQATRDAHRICEDQPALRGQFGRGLDLIELSASERGFDLESGRHDPGNAVDKELAATHRDQLPAPMKTIRRSRDRLRTRG